MGVTHKKKTKILDLLEKIAENSVGNVTWKTIFDGISISMSIDNWMVVRDVLQILIDNGVYTRTKDVYIEEYVIDKGKL